MHNAEDFFAHLAAHVGGDVGQVVDALAIGMAIGIPNKLIILFAGELGARGWIAEQPRSPFATLLVQLTHQGREAWERGAHGRGNEAG